MGNKTKHTPGPWQIDSDGNIDSNSGLVALVYRNAIDRGSAEEATNANLIAAAPDLLAALRWLEAKARDVYEQLAPPKGLQQIAVQGALSEALLAARDAIAKAEGKAS